MDSKGFKKSVWLFNLAVDAQKAMAASKDEAGLCAAWKEFLQNSNSVYDILKTYASKSAESKNWFGKKMHERRNDPLLRYLHAARNCEEHDIDSGLKFSPYLSKTPLEEDTHFTSMTVKDGMPIEFKGTTSSGRAISMQVRDMQPPVPFLVTVIDRRFNDAFAPPENHLNEKINGEDPFLVSSAFLKYMKIVLSEAESFIEMYDQEFNPEKIPRWIITNDGD